MILGIRWQYTRKQCTECVRIHILRFQTKISWTLDPGPLDPGPWTLGTGTNAAVACWWERRKVTLTLLICFWLQVCIITTTTCDAVVFFETFQVGSRIIGLVNTPSTSSLPTVLKVMSQAFLLQCELSERLAAIWQIL